MYIGPYRCRAEAEKPVGESGRAREWAGERACEFTGSFQTRTSAANFKAGSCIRLVFALHLGTCCVLAQRGGGVTLWHIGLSSFVLWKFIVGFVFVSHCFSFILFYFALVCVACTLFQVLGLKWLTQEKKLVSVLSFSEGACGSEQPCSLFVLFELCRSLFSQAELPDRIHSWPVTGSNLAFCMWDDHGFFCLSRNMQIRARGLSPEQGTHTRNMTWKVVNWIFSPPQKKKKNPASLPESTRLNFSHSLQKDKRHCSCVPLMAEFTLRL